MSDETERDEELEATPDLTDVTSIKRTRDRARREERERAAFWRAVLANKIGRRELWRLIGGSDWGHAFSPLFACGPNGTPQPEATWFHAGAQDLALRLYLALLAIDLVGVTEMHREHDPRFVRPKKSRAS